MKPISHVDMCTHQAVSAAPSCFSYAALVGSQLHNKAHTDRCRNEASLKFSKHADVVTSTKL
eukprot:1141432-Pelagomonas_calceolata.AAC.9